MLQALDVKASPAGLKDGGSNAHSQFADLSRLFELRVPSAVAALGDVLDTALVGVLPLALFASGHVYWVQHASHEALGMAPYALRPQLVPLTLTAGTESAELIGLDCT